MTRFFPLTAMLALCACVPSNPLVSQYNGDSVNLQTSSFATEDKAKVQAEADRICAKGGKRAEYASTRQLPDYILEHLYLCL